ncbi:hypothetical protein BDR06DRAFT_1015698 [Suillus hirtellus]|nr:hypothetical protein BDR06DRAFT_1015698 [Suillus hirtellus]
MLVYKLVALASAPIHVHFIFDRYRPLIKRSKHELLHIFVFTCATARGEAEIDLAFLSKAGKISAVLTEDGDALLFGTEKFYTDGTFIVDVCSAETLSNDPKIPLTTARLLVWAMLRGGDYNLMVAAPAQLPGMLETWRDRLRTVLVYGTLGRKYPTLAASIPAEFLSVDVMHLYLNPVTTWSDSTSSSLPV